MEGSGYLLPSLRPRYGRGLLLLGVTDQPNNFVYTPRPSLPAVVPLILPGTWLLVIGALNLFYGISVIAGSHIFITAAAWLTDDAQPWGGLMVVVGLIQMASAPAVFLFRAWAIAIGVLSVLLHLVAAILFVDNSEGIAIALLVLDLVVLGSFIAGIEESRTRAAAAT